MYQIKSTGPKNENKINKILRKELMQLVSMKSLTVKKFLSLPYEEQFEVLEMLKTDYVVVKDLIRDRNEFRTGYYKLADQLRDLGVEPKETSYLKGLYKHV